MKFGENLKQIRKSQKLSQEALAQKVNVSRQSVSKWENGEAYPEMNNILELCKIFNCQINDLVHSDMKDLSSLDEEIIMNIVKFNENEQTEVRSLSNVISLIAKIGSIVLKVAIPFVIIAMILLPYIITNLEIKGDIISFKTENIKMYDDKLEIYDIVLFDLDEELSAEDMSEIFEDHSRLALICYIEAGLVFIIGVLVLMIFILGFVEKLFNNIKNNHTPFTLDNVQYIKKMAYLMIVLILVSPIPSILLGLISDKFASSSSYDLMNILEILIIFSMSYIFRYGYEIQKDSKGKMYDK